MKTEHEGIKSVSECIRLVFDDVLERVSLTLEGDKALMQSLNRTGNLWNSKYLFRGPKTGVRELLGQMLERRAQDPKTDGFYRVESEDDGFAQGVVQILSGWGNRSGFHPTSIWRVGQEYSFLDYPDEMEPLLRLGVQHGVSRVTFTYDDDQSKWMEEWRNKKGTTRCAVCEREYQLEQCVDLEMRYENGKLFALFRCPTCRVSRLDSL